jgi:hypothetical protein
MKKVLLLSSMLTLATSVVFAEIKTTTITLTEAGARTGGTSTSVDPKTGTATVTANCNGSEGTCYNITVTINTAESHVAPLPGYYADITTYDTEGRVQAFQRGNYVSHERVVTESGVSVNLVLSPIE